MAEAVVSFTVERLADLLISEAKFLTGVSHQVRDIQLKLKEIQSFLKDADKQRGNQRVGKWVAEVRDVALMMEDVLETYSALVESKKGGGKIKKLVKRFVTMFGEGITLHKIGSEIGKIQEKVTKLATGTQTFGLQALQDIESENSNAEQQRQRLLRMSYSHLIERDFVGMEEEIQELVSHLEDRDRGCQVFSIWGMGGQGKTTLANKVYNHNNVKTHFQASAWVCLTQSFEPKRVWQDILKGLSSKQRNEEIMDMGDSELVEELYKIQQEKNCLVVIDDIWSLADWLILRAAFPVGEELTGSKIMLTTRNQEVANIGFPYKLRSLSEEEGWKLLCMKAFPVRHHHPAADYAAAEDRVLDLKKEMIGKDMVRKCRGLPLAIAALGGLLKNKTAVRDWETVNKDITSNLSREGAEYGNVRQILGLSYDDLPIRYKQLFLYLGNFKEDERIDTEKLYLLWIAEGMVCSSHQEKGEMLMDVAERYLVELAHRSLVQLEPSDELVRILAAPYLKFQSCHLHDLIRDVCLSKGKEEGTLNVVDFRDIGAESLDSSNVVVDTEACRLAIYLRNDIDTHIPLEQQHVVGQLRSLLFFSVDSLPQKVQNLKEFKLVRVLTLDNFKFKNKKLPPGLSCLIHLRYLSFNGSELDEIPSCIGDLRYLETLDLMVDDVALIPNVLWRLRRLKHLYLPECSLHSGEMLTFNGLDKLELLTCVDANLCNMDDLLKLTRLQVLEATIKSPPQLAGFMDLLASDLHQWRHTWLLVENFDLGVSHLSQLLECNSLHTLEIRSNVGILPKEFNYQSFSESLIDISLVGCEYEEDPMVFLEKFPNLERLTLEIDSYIGEEILCSATGFPSLKRLGLEKLPHLKKWKINEGAMPNLAVLDITNCSKLKMLPEGLKFLTSLLELNIEYMPKTFTDRINGEAQGVGLDYYKACHVSSITIFP